MKKWILLLSLLSLAACQQAPTSPNTEHKPIKVPAGINFVEQVSQQGDETVIPYQKYQLDNGLTLILHQDKSDPLVHVDVTYHVGSAREKLGKSGFAHFFEHMMFQGSENVADEQHIKTITEVGGTMNGTTNSDRTNYFQTVPANQLEKVLWLEADRMGFFLDAVTQEKFEVQRETVKNERGQSYDNRPYGLLYERVAEALYPPGHPYSWQTIGYIEDLNRVDVNDLKAFFKRWYGPNNATLTIGGDIDIEEVLRLTNKYFGTIARGPEVAMPEKPPVTLAENRYISMEDNVHLPLVYLSMPTVYVRHEDEAPLDILSNILGGGKTSLLYKNLVKKQYAVQAQVSHPCGELACSFNLYALPHPVSGKSLKDIETIIRNTLDEFEQRGVEDDDLTKVKATMEAGFIFGLQSVRGKVSQLAANETFTGNPNYIEHDIARYANVTKEDVMRVYKQYIKNKPAVVMSIVPKGKPELVAQPDNFVAKRLLPDNYQSKSVQQAVIAEKPKDNFDRSIAPKSGGKIQVTLPETWQHNFNNGISVLGAQNTETPTSSVLLKIPAGHYFEDKSKAGTASILAQMLNESTKQRSGEEMSQALEMLGSEVSISAYNQYISVKINSLTKALPQTLALVVEKLAQPAFHEQDFNRVKANAIQGAINNKKNAGYLARTAYRQLLHADNIAATPIDGSEQTLTELSLADVVEFYQSNFNPAGAKLITVSNLDKKALLTQLTDLENWQTAAAEPSQDQTKNVKAVTKADFDFPLADTKPGRIYLVDKQGAAQSAIRIGKRSLTETLAGEYYQVQLMNFPLGGAFNSRINLNLREKNGYSYGARSGFYANPYTGMFSAGAEVRANVTDKAIVEIINEIKGYVESGITDEELSFMRSAISLKDALKYETPNAKLGFLSKLLDFNVGGEFVAERAELVNTISAEQINALAKKHLNIDEMIIVVVGDAKTLTPQLQALGYEVVPHQI